MKKIERIKELLYSFGDKLEAIVLFGSYARGNFHRYSDIDLLVVLRNAPRHRSEKVELVLEALGEFSEEVNPLVIGVNGLKPVPILLEIALTGKVLFDRGAFSRFIEEVKRRYKIERRGEGKWVYMILHETT